MRHLNSTISASVIAFASMLLPATASATKTLIYSDHEPLRGMRTLFLNDVFFPAIERESAGRLKIDAHWGSEISTGYEALYNVGQDGHADIATVVPEYSADKLPLHQIFKSFPAGPSGIKQIEFFLQVYTKVPTFTAELQAQNGVPVMLATGFPVAFFSTTPLQNLDGIKGKKWRTASFWHQNFLRNAGATPVTIPWGEKVFDALKEKALDGLIVNIDSGADINAQDMAPYVLTSKDLWLGHLYLVVMNKKTWDGLSEEDQQAIHRAAASSYLSLGTLMESSFAKINDKMKQDGINIRTLTPQDIERWKVMSKYQQVQDDWLKVLEAKGVKDGAKTLKQVTAIMNDTLNK